ncbi:MAG: glycerol kinase GlpK [bacterium]|nr:glycerol kinase GlpK [bacterium]
MQDCILAIDQGTTGSTALVIDAQMNLLGRANVEFSQHYPQAGWVEHDPDEIWESVLKAIAQALKVSGIEGGRIAAIGITNQRETTLIWDRANGQPLAPAIVWQDRRTAPLCERLQKKGSEISKRTGLRLHPYFSATKIQWLLDHHEGARPRAQKGELCFGTINSYLVYRLTGQGVHVTDVSNASRTLLMNLKNLEWDPVLLKIFNIPAALLPRIASCSEQYGVTKGVEGLPNGIPITGMAGDQQAALFGQACFEVGDVKCTYGTGSFLLMNTGQKPVFSKSGMLTTVAWQLKGKTTYALEGSAFIAGAAIQWLRDNLKIIPNAAAVEELALTVSDNGGVTFVPALVGLGAPYWKTEAHGLLSGLSRATQNGHIARAVLEGIAFLQYDILQAMSRDLGKKLKTLKVDGGASVNNLLMQFQADILGVEIVRPRQVETTALGAAFLAGLGVGLWKDLEDISIAWKEAKRFRPEMPKAEQKRRLEQWHTAVKKA